MQTLHAVAASAVLLSIAPAQTVWNATSSDLTPIFAQATPGDIVLLSSNVGYLPFHLNKGLTLIGPAGGSGWVGTGPTNGPVDTRILIPSGERARFVNLHFASLLPTTLLGHQVQASGDITFEDCVFDGTSYGTPHVIVGGNVRMNHCRIGWSNAKTSGLIATSGYVSLTDCDLGGTPAAWDPFGAHRASTSGLTIDNATVVASLCSIRGGSAAVGLPPSPGANISGNSGRLFLSDSIVSGGNGGYGSPWFVPGAPALAVSTTGASLAEVARSTFSGGLGTVNGPPMTGNATFVPELVGIRIDHGFVRGQTTTVTATAGSSQLLLGIFGSFDPNLSTYPLVIEPALQTAFGVTLATPAAGALVTAPIAIPNMSALLGVEAWLQALQLTSGPVRASAVVGGVVH
ncbi:MAG: right-handed parallel beta-helix repeat-containing protein [Planctomycetes bacterium]|nr:right-handed parallel beta-helix repeat-containing protein [Planctomycetota bacterium]